MNSRVNRLLATISLHAVALAADVALCASLPFDPVAANAAAPEWVHLLPAGDIRTRDGRGPYRVADMHALIADSLPEGGRLVIDENHATDLAAPEGRPAPAMGWIVQLESRADGLWGKVEWTDAGKALVAGRAYRGLSPALKVEKGSAVVAALLRASLVNLPNIKNLVTLHQETAVNPLLAKLIAALALANTTSEDTLVAAVTTLHQAQTAHTTELQSIATAAGLEAVAGGLTGQNIIGAIAKLKATPGSEAITALQSELKTVTIELNSLKSTGAKDKATAYVDGAIKAGKVGVKPLRDHYISRHMADPAGVEKEIGSFPVLGSAGSIEMPTQQGDVSLNAEEQKVVAQLGLDPKKFIATRDGTVVA